MFSGTKAATALSLRLALSEITTTQPAMEERTPVGIVIAQPMLKLGNGCGRIISCPNIVVVSYERFMWTKICQWSSFICDSVDRGCLCDVRNGVLCKKVLLICKKKKFAL